MSEILTATVLRIISRRQKPALKQILKQLEFVLLAIYIGFSTKVDHGENYYPKKKEPLIVESRYEMQSKAKSF